MNKRKKDIHKKLDFVGYGMDKDDVLNGYLPYRVIDIEVEAVTVQIGANDLEDLLSVDVRESWIERGEKWVYSIVV